MVDGRPLYDPFHMLDLVARCTLLNAFFVDLSGPAYAYGMFWFLSSGERLALALRVTRDADLGLAPALPCFLSCALLIR
jgi:hypothetical protein